MGPPGIDGGLESTESAVRSFLLLPPDLELFGLVCAAEGRCGVSE